MTNTVLLVGNLGADPSTRQSQSGGQITTVNLGTSRVRRDQDGKTFKDESGYTAKDTEWHRITCFGGLAKAVAELGAKGRLVSVQGRIHYTKWTDSAGVERYGCEIIAEDVQFLNRPQSGAAANDQEPAAEALPAK